MNSLTSSKDAGRRPLLVVLPVVIALVVGLFLGLLLAPDGNEPNGPRTNEDSTQAGEPVEQSEAGAVEAATEFARLVSAPSDEMSYREAVQRLASPEWRERADELARNTLQFLEDRYGTGGWWSFVPARYRVAEYSESAATIELWGVTVATGPKVQGVEETWITGTLELTWTPDGWRVSGEEAATGPTPELLTTQDDLDASVLDDFSEYPSGPTP